MFKEAWASFRRVGLPWEDDRTRLLLATGLLVAAVLINGFVCGALSGPFARYQARIVWLITLGAAVAMVSLVPARASLPVPVWVQRRLEHPLAQAALMFARFFGVGIVGFCVDYVILTVLLSLHAGFNYFTARLVSFSVAVCATLLLNRSFTFMAPAHHGPWRQAALYVAVQVTGGALNIAVYSLAIRFIPLLNHARFVPLAMGSAAGLCLTFLGSKYLAFKPAAAAAEVPEAMIPNADIVTGGRESPADNLVKPPEAAA